MNAIRSDGLPLVGDYREIDLDRTAPIVPPEAAEGDPPFIAVDVAHLDLVSGAAVFVDARETDEFECGTIPGSINIPFDYLPEDDDLRPYFDSALGYIAADTRLVLFCSGEECDLSLHLGRNMQYFGFTNVAIFFGGAREWERVDLEMERRRVCDE
jgi:rhodanese-related sulfurtransferase